MSEGIKEITKNMTREELLQLIVEGFQILGIVGLEYVGEFDINQKYTKGDVVRKDGSSYVAKSDTEGNDVTDEKCFMLIALAGADYQVTEEDLAIIAKRLSDDANSDFNKNVTEKTSEYNTNATNKTTDFNSNATSKTTSFNNNYDDKLEAFNDNVTTKTNEFNVNVTDKTTSFNDNSESKTNTFNTNAETKMTDYNSNADNKLTEYNENAVSKVEEFNTSVDSIRHDIDTNTSRIMNIESDLFDSGEAEGEAINVKDSALAEAIRIDSEAGWKQGTTKGKQLFDVEDSNFKTSGVTLDGDWITINYDNSSGNSLVYQNYYTRPSNLIKESTDYKVIVEIKNITGNGEINFVSNASTYPSQIDTGFKGGFNSFTNNTIVQKQITSLDDFSNSKTMIRTFAAFYPGTSGSITFRISVLEDLTITPETFVYEKYTGGESSPSLPYKQDIEVIEAGDYEFTTCANNFIPTDKKFWESGHYELDDELHKDGFTTRMRLKEIVQTIPRQTFTCKNYAFIIRGVKRDKKSVVNIGVIGKDKTFVVPDDVYYLAVAIDNVYDEYEESNPPIICLASSESNDSVYITSKLPFTIPKGQFFANPPRLEGDKLIAVYNENDKHSHLYLQKNIGRTEVLSTDSIYLQSINKNNISNFRIVAKSKFTDNYTKRGFSKSNHLLYDSALIADAKREGFTFSVNNEMYMRFNADDISSVEELKDWLKTNKLYFYYELAEPYLIDLGIKDMPLTFFKETNLFNDFPLPVTMKLYYYRDFKGTIEQLQENWRTAQQEIIKLQTDVESLKGQMATILASMVQTESEVNEDDIPNE